MRRREVCRVVSLAAAAAVAGFSSPRAARAWFVLPPLVFDAQQFAQRVQDVARQAEQAARIGEQLEGERRMLAATDVSTLGDVRAGIDRICATLALIRAAPADAGDDLDRRYPNDWVGGPTDASRFERVQDAWASEGRHAVAEARAAQNAVVREMPAAAGRVARLVTASGDAPGLTAALQARTQLHAELSAEVAKLQALRDSKAFADAEREGAAQSGDAYAAAAAEWLERPDTVPPVAGGRGAYAPSPIPEPAYEGRR